MIEQYICLDCGGTCKFSTLSRKRVCRRCNQLWEEKDVLVETRNMANIVRRTEKLI